MNQKPTLFKQLLGALGGALVALVLFAGYRVAKPVLTTWLTVPLSRIESTATGALRLADETLEVERRDRMENRARQIAVMFSDEGSTSSSRSSSKAWPVPEDDRFFREDTIPPMPSVPLTAYERRAQELRDFAASAVNPAPATPPSTSLPRESLRTISDGDLSTTGPGLVAITLLSGAFSALRVWKRKTNQADQ